MPTPSSTPRLRLRVTATAEDILRRGHPWLFADSIRDQNRPGSAGELGVVYDRRNDFLAIGLYDPASPIRLRILHTGKPVTLDDAWWRARLQSALDRRRGLFDDATDGHRWIHGESDGWPGLVLDRYAGVLVLKLYTAAWLPHVPRLLNLFRDTLQPHRLVLRLSRNLQSVAHATSQLHDGLVLLGNPLDQTPVFRESGLWFEADVIRGQKTGFFLDQRENRRRVEALARGREVLNAFSFSGGFSLYAARGGARAVTSLDLSPHALEASKRNFLLNQADSAVAGCAHRTVQADVFEWLSQQPARRFDLIILDPPSLARRETERAGAIRAYGRIAADAVRLLRPGGMLVAASCSAHVSAEEFFGAVRGATRHPGRPFTELATTAHPPDHPASFPEAHYLKCIYLEG